MRCILRLIVALHSAALAAASAHWCSVDDTANTAVEAGAPSLVMDSHPHHARDPDLHNSNLAAARSPSPWVDLGVCWLPLLLLLLLLLRLLLLLLLLRLLLLLLLQLTTQLGHVRKQLREILSPMGFC
jgi:hypothetical protein